MFRIILSKAGYLMMSGPITKRMTPTYCIGNAYDKLYSKSFVPINTVTSRHVLHSKMLDAEFDITK